MAVTRRLGPGASAVVAALPAIALAALVLAPFLRSAFTIDDPLFLYQARHLLQDPFHPTAFDVTWSTAPQRMSAIMASGPGMAYLLVPCVVFGGAEWIAHTLQLAMLSLALVATASLALRLGDDRGRARWAALLLAASPAALAMAGTAMPDVAAMALGALGIERASAWAGTCRVQDAVLCASALAAAALFRSHLIVLAPVALLAGVGRVVDRETWRRHARALAAPLTLTPLLFALVLAVTRDPQASAVAVAGAARTYVFGPALPRNAVSYFVHWALVLPLGVPWLLLHPRRVLGGPVFYVATAAAWLYIRSTPEVGPVAAAPAAGCGAAALWDLTARAIRGKDSTRLTLAAWIATPLAVLPYLHLPSKYLLSAAPAAALAVAGEAYAVPERRRRVALVTTLALGVVAGTLVLRANEAFAGLGRRAAEMLVAPSVAEGKTVWFNGHWGFQWYAERAGARPLTSGPPHPQWGDRVVSSLHAEDELMGAMPHRRAIRWIGIAESGGRTMSRPSGAGFFSNGWGYLPWAWGSDPLDRYDLWQLEPE